MPDEKKLKAGFAPRLVAYGVDKLMVCLVLLMVRIPAWVSSIINGSPQPILFEYTALDILCYGLSAAYFVLLTYFTGGTLGKKLMGIQVEKADGTALTLVDVLYRETVGRFLSGILFLGYLMALADRDKRAFHDWLCGTCVVYRERKAPAAPAAPAVWNNPAEYTEP